MNKISFINDINNGYTLKMLSDKYNISLAYALSISCEIMDDT